MAQFPYILAIYILFIASTSLSMMINRASLRFSAHSVSKPFFGQSKAHPTVSRLFSQSNGLGSSLIVDNPRNTARNRLVSHQSRSLFTHKTGNRRYGYASSKAIAALTCKRY